MFAHFDKNRETKICWFIEAKQRRNYRNEHLGEQSFGQKNFSSTDQGIQKF